MNLKNKKTVLSDEAAIYKHDDNVSEKEKWQNLSNAQRWEYFRDYYLAKIVVTLIIIAVVGSILHTMLTPKPEMVLAVAVINDSMYQQTYDELQKKVNEVLAVDEETQKTMFDTGYYIGGGDYQSWQKFTMYNAVGDLDVTILPLSIFEECAQGGFFSPVAELLPTDLYMALSEYMLETQLRDEDGNLIPHSETVLGISMDKAVIFKGQQRAEPMVLAINAAPANVENIEKFLRVVFFEEEWN